MSSSLNNTTNLAFFGATGGCANACLVHTLKAGHKVSVLARTPSKLTNQLLSQGLDQATIDNFLTIIQGNATDVEAVKRTLSPPSNNSKIVSTIISGIGGSPKFQASLTTPVTIDNPNICENAANTLVAAVKDLQSTAQTEEQRIERRPLVVVVSTTGISSGPDDVPFMLRFLYHYILAVPHVDKRKMEEALLSNADGSNASGDILRGAVVLRPALLTGDISVTGGKGWKTLKVGTEKTPAVGFSIKRADVGEWIFEEIIKSGGEKWVNEKVTLTS
jgi:hypothetical protein